MGVMGTMCVGKYSLPQRPVRNFTWLRSIHNSFVLHFDNLGRIQVKKIPPRCGAPIQSIWLPNYSGNLYFNCFGYVRWIAVRKTCNIPCRTRHRFIWRSYLLFVKKKAPGFRRLITHLKNWTMKRSTIIFSNPDSNREGMYMRSSLSDRQAGILPLKTRPNGIQPGGNKKYTDETTFKQKTLFLNWPK